VAWQCVAVDRVACNNWAGRALKRAGKDVTGRPAQLILIASVARRYYLENKSKIEIAEELGMSRFKVARLLETARESGLVHIEIADPDMIEVDLSARLQDAYGLQHAVVVDSPDDNTTTLRECLGKAAAELVSEILTTEDVLGLAWSRSVSAMTNALTQLPTIAVVQLSGALVQPGVADSSVDLVRQAARISGGAAHYLLPHSRARPSDRPRSAHAARSCADIRAVRFG
jgi:DNA-binding transcriptional regulator LsrR (DeoR family)